MSATGSGLPYPESTASLQQGANDIKALALALDPRATYRVMVVNREFTTNAQGLCTFTTPGPPAGGVLTYRGIYGPIIVNLRSFTGNVVEFGCYRPDSSPVVSVALDVSGVVFYS